MQGLVLDLADVAREEGLVVVGLAKLPVLLNGGHVAELLPANSAGPNAFVLKMRQSSITNRRSIINLGGLCNKTPYNRNEEGSVVSRYYRPSGKANTTVESHLTIVTSIKNGFIIPILSGVVIHTSLLRHRRNVFNTVVCTITELRA